MATFSGSTTGALGLGALKGIVGTQEKLRQSRLERDKEALRFVQTLLTEGWKPVDKSSSTGEAIVVPSLGMLLQPPKIDKVAEHELKLKGLKLREKELEVSGERTRVDLSIAELRRKNLISEHEARLKTEEYRYQTAKLQRQRDNVLLAIEQLRKQRVLKEIEADKLKLDAINAKNAAELKIFAERLKIYQEQTEQQKYLTEAQQLKLEQLKAKGRKVQRTIPNVEPPPGEKDTRLGAVVVYEDGSAEFLKAGGELVKMGKRPTPPTALDVEKHEFDKAQDLTAQMAEVMEFPNLPASRERVPFINNNLPPSANYIFGWIEETFGGRVERIELPVNPKTGKQYTMGDVRQTMKKYPKRYKNVEDVFRFLQSKRAKSENPWAEGVIW